MTKPLIILISGASLIIVIVIIYSIVESNKAKALAAAQQQALILASVNKPVSINSSGNIWGQLFTGLAQGVASVVKNNNT